MYPIFSSVGYVEFYDEATVQSALAMSGQKLLGIPVVVQVTEAEKNRLAMQAQSAYVFPTIYSSDLFPTLTRTFVTYYLVPLDIMTFRIIVFMLDPFISSLLKMICGRYLSLLAPLILSTCTLTKLADLEDLHSSSKYANMLPMP